ncbi:MAG TPA: UDP-N-acetylmuramate--L-alanine ligase, partial [Spirochaetota bacterium]|nr:UDP-N-acetylmuramate--L-alanine ligase [Spirochaetota bacterium]
VSAALIKDAIHRNGKRDVEIISRFEDIPKTVIPRLKKGDILLTLGAGDITKAGPMVLAELRK